MTHPSKKVLRDATLSGLLLNLTTTDVLTESTPSKSGDRGPARKPKECGCEVGRAEQSEYSKHY